MTASESCPWHEPCPCPWQETTESYRSENAELRAEARVLRRQSEAVRASSERAEAFSIKSQQRQVDRLLEEVQVAAVADRFDPHGNFVYTLRDRVGEPLYVGLSTNVLSRVGGHLGRPDWRPRIDSVELLRCGSETSMRQTEGALIRRHRPPWNTVGVR